MDSAYRVAGIDVHKKMLAVVLTDVAMRGDYAFERRRFGTGAAELQALADWLRQQGVREVVTESTAQYWRPVWLALEPGFKLHLAQAQSNKAPKGRKPDFADAERLVRRHVAGELILNLVPDEEQRLWRTLARSNQQLTRERVRLRNQMEALLEDSRIKLSSHLSDLFGVSGKKMLRALAQGEADPARIAALALGGIRATPEQLRDGLRGAAQLIPLRRQILRLFLERLDLVDRQMEELEQSLAGQLRPHADAVTRLAAVPGLGADSAHQIVAEIGPQAAPFHSPGQLASWVGCCPGREESAEVSRSNRSPKENPAMRRILCQAANAAVKAKGSVFQDRYRRLVPRLGHLKTIWAIAHKLCRIVWKILHHGVTYQERGQSPDPETIQRRIGKLLRQLRALGYPVQSTGVA
jgi:transposase